MWNTPAIERLGLPAVCMTDGPNGARGSALLGLGDVTAVCIPCGSALGASFDPELIERVGRMLGQEARTKAARILLAPTINLHRSPLGGRGFECYSEDPLLSGKIAAGFIRGVQSEGVVTTAKHFVANDAEFERNTIDSVVDERTLREIYLLPFELAVKEGGALGIMTSYNRLNGTYCSEDRVLLQQILRDEWGFEGFVVTDWFSAGGTVDSSEAGLDLQMPGPGRFFGPALAEAVREGKVDEALVDAQVRRMLSVWSRIGALDDAPGAEEQSIDLPEHRALARESAAASMVLLSNDGLLPLAAPGSGDGAPKRIAVIGPNADRAQIYGGGSAALRPHYRVTPLDALQERIGDAVEIVHRRGCWTERTTPAVAGPALVTPSGERGFAVEYYGGTNWEGDVLHRRVNADGQFFTIAPPPEGVPSDGWSSKAVARFTPEQSGHHVFTLVQGGGTRLLVNGEVVLDGIENRPKRGTAFFGMASEEIEASVALEAGTPVELEVQYSTEGAFLLRGVNVGHRPPLGDDPIEDAVQAARDADVAILVVGTNADWETEGRDRTSMELPGDQDELIRRVCAANPRTIVCVNSGSPVSMDWVDDPAAILQIWFGGQEMADALVDVLFGETEPSGRLPMTLPLRVEHNPSYGNFPGENSELRYGEGLLVGYRWYETRHLPTRFAFGHGLSYSSFEIGEPRLSSDTQGAGDVLRVEVPITNTGSRRAAEVVQCYVAPESSKLMRPRRELKAFEKVWLDPGESTVVTLELGDRAFAYWDTGDRAYPALLERPGGVTAAVPSGGGKDRRQASGWYLDAGRYALHIGRSSAETAHVCSVTIQKEAGPLAP
jgi:beta-glucosidase